MKLLAICVVLLGCSKSAEGPDRWPEVERLATPTVPGGEGALLDKALERITDDDVPELALEDVIAWRKAGGGVGWRSGRAMDDRRPLKVFKLGKALVERRSADPEAVHAALYLGHRMRAEAPSLLDVMIGFEITKLVVEAKLPTKPELAPTEAEIRRSLAADAVFMMRTVDGDAKIEPSIAKQLKKDYAAMLLGGPSDRAAYKQHVAAMITKAEKSELMKMLVAPRTPKLVDDMFAIVDSYR